MRKSITLLTLAASAGVLPGAFAQVIVGPQRQVNPQGQSWKECFVAARQMVTSEVVVSAHGGGTHYGISLDGGTTFTTGTYTEALGDTCVAVDPLTDRIWYSALAFAPGGAGGTVKVASKNPGTNFFFRLNDATAFAFDKPLMAIGPRPGGVGPSRHYLLYSGIRRPGGDAVHSPWAAWSDTPTDEQVFLGNARVEPQPVPAFPHYTGWGAMPVVLSTGRVVVVNRGKDFYNNNLPYVVYSDDGGMDWKPDDVSPVAPVLVAEGSGIEATTIDVPPSEPGDTPFTVDRRTCAPSIARDPNNDDVFVAFYARSAPGSTNTDIFISRSNNGGESFPALPGFLLQLTDGMIGAGSDADQLVPGIAVDACGGVNVHFYDTRNDSPGDDRYCVDVVFVRITGFGTPSQSIFWTVLTPSTTAAPASGFLGDYHSMAVSGATLYPGYIITDDLCISPAPDPATVVQNCYVHKIRIVCFPSDFNGNAVSDPGDADLFTAAYEALDPEADLNGDSFVDVLDHDIFWDDYESR